jgi:glycerol-3-phosphate dehydrogenase (NAD(P)+)
MNYIAVIGGGSWGTTIAKMLAEKGYDVALWVFEENLANEIRNTRINSVYLPDVLLPHNIFVSSDMEIALKNARFLVNVVPSQHTREVFIRAMPYISDSAIVVSASKGIEIGTFLTVSRVINDITGRSVSVLSGPSFSDEVKRRLPTAVTLASDDWKTALLLQEIFTTDYFRVYTHDDILGVELGGALKNVMAIAAGISDGLGLGNNARAAMITRGLQEMKRFGVALGAREQTFYGLSGLGDLVLTCTATLSRNYSFGLSLSKGKIMSEILSSTKSVVEGVYTAKAAYELARLKGVDMPIVEQIHEVLYSGKDPGRAVSDLMNRALKAEFHG